VSSIRSAHISLIVVTYEEGVDDAVLLRFDFVRPIQLEISVEMFGCRRRYEHPVRLAGGFDAGGDVDGVSPYGNRVRGPTQCGTTVLATRCTKGGCKPNVRRRMPGAGLSR